MIKVNYLGGIKFSAEARGHVIESDQPKDNGGTDGAMTPPELLASSLGTCIGVYVVRYLQQIGVDPAGMTVEVKYETVPEPLRIGRLYARVAVPAGIPESRRAAVHKVAEHCLIHQTLCTEPETVIEIV